MNDVPRGVFFVDLDGTLVGRDGIAERVWPALASLRASGWRVSVCTGRPGRGIALDVARRVDPEGLHVFESGAVVMRGDGSVVRAEVIAAETVVKIAALGVARGVTLEAYSADGRYLVREMNAYIRGHEALLGFASEVVAWPPTAPIVRLQWVVPDAAWEPLRAAAGVTLDAVSAHVGQSPRMPGVSFVSMTAPGVSKATGVRVVLEALGLASGTAAIAGDNHNDIPAFGCVGAVFVPVDGVPEALALAHHIVPSADEGGVADAVALLLARSGV